jgi:hypothetical protein
VRVFLDIANFLSCDVLSRFPARIVMQALCQVSIGGVAFF